MGFFSDRQSLWQGDPGGVTVPNRAPQMTPGRISTFSQMPQQQTMGQPAPTQPVQPPAAVSPAVATSGTVNTPAPAGATPQGAPGATGGNLEAAIAAYQQANPYSPQAYEGLFEHLKQQGFKVERPTRAGGTKLSDDKIVGPDGKMYDLTVGVDGPNPTWAAPQHIPGEYWFNGQRVQRTEELGPGGGGWDPSAQGRLSSFGAPGLAAPWTEEFQYPKGTDDPGFQWAMEQGVKGIQNSAAAKGTLLTGGLLKDLANYTTGAALQDYRGTWDRAKNVYDTNQRTWYGNQNSAYDKLSGIANTGARAAGDYASGMGNMITAGANAGAQATGANAANWQNTFGNLATLGTGIFQDQAAKRKAAEAARRAGQIPAATPPYVENPGFD